MSFDNPFRESRLNVARNYRPEWDVPELNLVTTNWLVEQVRHLKGRREPDPGQMIAVVTGPPGYGKTHLFGRIEHSIGHEVFFVFVPEFIEQTPPLEHICRHVVEALWDAPDGGHSPLELALASLCRPAFATYFENLPPTLAARHETMGRRLQDAPDAVLEVVRQVKSLSPFMKLADSLIQVIPHNAGIVRALALGWAPDPWSSTARRWLQGQDLPDADRDVLGLSELPPPSIDVLRAIPALFANNRPMMICCDQIESILQGKNGDSINRLTTSMMELLQAVPVQIVLNCFLDSWDDIVAKAFAAFKMRVHKTIFRLEPMKDGQPERLVKNRMASWSGRSADRPPCWPFKVLSVGQWVKNKKSTPRGLIQECGTRFDDWIEAGGDGEIDLLDGVPPEVDVTAVFLQEWNRELGTIAKDPKRAADYIAEDRLYFGILEALKLAQSAQRMREFGGVRVVEVRDKAVKATAPAQRPGASVLIAGKAGETSQTVIVALTTVQASQKLTHYFKALFTASADPAAGAVLIHPRRDLDMGPGTRTLFEEAQRAGRLRVMPLEDYPLSYHATECLAAMIDRANARELIINGVTLSAEDCRDLVIKTGVIDNLDLFKMLGRWKRPAAGPGPAAVPSAVAVGPQAAVASPAAKAEPVPVPEQKPVPVAAEVPVPAAGEPPPASKPGAADTGPWADLKLAAAVKKLKLLGLGVEPDGFEVGPTFVRLRVRPVGKTSFKAVCNQAVDMRISLDLKAVPMIGSQGGYISIDVQRPDRAVVTLAEALAGPTPGLEGLPAFPVGVDVAGQAHWLNLADPSDCHLLVAGTTGSGKSEFLRAAIAAMASRLGPDRLQFLLIDPKRVTFNLAGASPYLRAPIAYDLEAALPLIEACMAEMDRRYQILQDRKLSNVGELPPEMLPRIVVIIDEFASFLEDKKSKKVVTALLKRIGAMARAAGIHLILATQRPDKDVITPLLRENLPGRVALKVSSKAGSQLILGADDAEHLLGRGDLLWRRGGELLRLQSPFIPQADLERVLRCAR